MPYFSGDDSYTITTFRNSGGLSTVFSPDGSLLYVATTAGRIDIYDTATGTKIDSWNTGGTPGGISLSDDGSTLLVTIPEGNASNAGLIRVFDTATGGRSSITGSTAFYDVEIVDANHAVVTGPQVFEIELSSGRLTPLDGASDYSSAYSVLVEDGHYTLIAEPGISNGPLALYDDRTGTIVATGDNYQDNVYSGFNWGSQAISEAAGMIVQFNYYGSINVYDLQLRAVTNVYLGNTVDGMIFSSDGGSLYVFHSEIGQLVQYNTDNWNVVESFSLASNDWNNTIGFGDQVVISPTGDIAITNTSNGRVQFISLSGRNETFRGTADADTMEGRAGDDTYYVNHVDDQVIEASGGGNDTIYLRNLTTYVMPNHVETLRIASGAPSDVTGNNGRNFIYGSGFADTIDGLRGNDLIEGGRGSDTLRGSAGDDRLFGGDDDDFLYGGGDNDLLDGGTGADYMSGGTGDDVYVVDDLGDVIVEYGGNGTDTVQTALAEYMLGRNLENLTGLRNGAQILRGNDLANQISGGRYADQLFGEEGNDELSGGAGNDRLYGGIGNDELIGGAGNDILDGGTGNDRMIGGSGDDIYYVDDFGDEVVEEENGGTDTVYAAFDYYLGYQVENAVGLLNGGFITISGNELDNNIRLTGSGWGNLYGGYGNDYLRGADGDDNLDGGDGNDRLIGGRGSDTLYGDWGNDSLYGGSGHDNLDGGFGDDRLIGGAGNDYLYGGDGYDELFGGSGKDTLVGGYDGDLLSGGAGNDTYYVSTYATTIIENVGKGKDTVITDLGTYVLGANLENLTGTGQSGQLLVGNALSNVIEGGWGNDQIEGRDGKDTLIGGFGFDVLIGGAGSDILTGGGDADLFYFDDGDLGSMASNTDRITDFTRAEGDLIDLSAIDANTNQSGDQAFTFIGTNAFTGVAGQLRYVTNSSGATLQMDTNGDGAADLYLRLDDVTVLQVSDFVF